jgi:cation transport ATPase
MALIALAIPAATAFSAILGQGVRATGEGWEWMVGGPNPLEGIEAPVPGGLVRFAEQCAGRGEAVV